MGIGWRHERLELRECGRDLPLGTVCTTVPSWEGGEVELVDLWGLT